MFRHMARLHGSPTSYPGKLVLAGDPHLLPGLEPRAGMSSSTELAPGHRRSGRKSSRISAASSSGSSCDAKWPPRGISVQRATW